MKIPQFPIKLPGSFWGIAAFFNSPKYNYRCENYRVFRDNSKRQGLNLIAVELAFDDDPFALNKDIDAEILIQIRGTREKNLMWQKEQLLNIGLGLLPQDCDKVCWVDGDVIFKNDNWIKEVSGLLEKYVIVQPFTTAVLLNEGVKDLGGGKIKALPCGYGRNADDKTFGFNYSFVTFSILSGHPGFSWAIRREVISRHLFYNRFIMGGGDTAMATAFYGKSPTYAAYTRLTKKTFPCYAKWAEAVYKDVRGSAWYADNDLFHLWHGDRAVRLYGFRHEILKHFDFDSENDIRISPDGILEWSSDKPQFHKLVMEYFRFRDEAVDNVFASFMCNKVNEVMGIQFSKSYKAGIILRRLFYIVFFLPVLRRAVFYMLRKILL